MRLEQLQYFVQVVQRHSFNKAALALNITQPALTASMNALENELGVKLLVRSHKGVFPTSYGMRVYDDCKDPLLQLEEHMREWKEFRSQDQEQRQDVHLVAIPSACNYLVEELVISLQREFALNLTLHEETPLYISAFLQSGKARIGITALQKEEAQAELARYRSLHYQAHPLLDDEYHVFISGQHPLARKKSLSVEDCSSLHFATYSIERNNQDAIFQTAARLFSLQKVYYLNSRESIMQMIARNQAAGFFLHKMAGNNWYVKNGLIRTKPVQGMHLLPSTHYLLHLPQNALSPAENTVAAYLRKHYAPGA